MVQSGVLRRFCVVVSGLCEVLAGTPSGASDGCRIVKVAVLKG